MRWYLPHRDDLPFWVQDMRHSVEYTQRAQQNHLAGAPPLLEAMPQVAAEVPRRLGQWHGSMRVDLKGALLGACQIQGSIDDVVTES